MPLAEELKKVIKGEVLDDPATQDAYSRDASLFRVLPQVVVRPTDTNDLCALVSFVSNHKIQNPKSKISLTPRSAGTDMSGGPLGDSIVVDMTAHFNRLLELGEDAEGGYAVVEPGMYFRDFDKETKKKGLELPCYTASREINTVGGMVGNDSGGEKNLKYGKTARWVEELEVVMADGKAHVLPGDAGEWGGKVAALVGSHRGIIEQAAPKVAKVATGYPLWELGSPPNLARLMVGAQGTLGIVTKIKFRLVRPKPYAAMVVMQVRTLTQLSELVPEVLQYSPDSFEAYDDQTLKLALRYYPFAIQFIPQAVMAFFGRVPKLTLLAEFRGETQADALAQAQKLAADIANDKDHVRVHIARDETAARKYWTVRRESFNLLRKKVRGKRTAPFIDDFVVPPACLPEFMPKLQAIMAAHTNLTYTIAGHVGDGNFHIIPLIDPKDPTIAKTMDEVAHKVYDLVLSYQGSISGEHNDGLIRTPYVEKQFGPGMVALFYEIKKMFDPLNIFNPGKKVGTTFSDALAKLDLPKV